MGGFADTVDRTDLNNFSKRMTTKPENDTELHDKINQETARIKWDELERHFAQGAVAIGPAAAGVFRDSSYLSRR
jgi:crotonobetainyl-CoA:carnitine CoA-transferase CaiB-like acyl-CoA transferase